MLTLPSWSSKASHTILFRKMLKRVGESRHPWRTPTVVLNHSPVLPLNRTALWTLSYRFSMARMMLALMLYFLIVAHKASCHTLSKAFLKSMNSSIPWISPEIRSKIRRKNKTHAKAKKTGSGKLRSKFETLRREIKADVRKQHDLYVNNLVGDVKANPRDFYRYINSQKKDTQDIPPLKRKNGKGVAQSDLEKAEEFNGQFTDVFNKNEHTQVPLLDRSAPFMNDIAVSKDGVIKLLKGLNCTPVGRPSDSMMAPT